MLNTIKVNFDIAYERRMIDIRFNDIVSEHNLIACDFETASIFSDKCKKIAAVRKRYINKDNWEAIRGCDVIINSDGLSNVRIVEPTHLSIAWSEKDATVFILDTTTVSHICELLTNTKVKQIWHNAGYDFSFIFYYTHQYPQDYEDTELMVKCLTSNVKSYRSPAKLKILEGNYYGKWGISKDNFNLNNKFDKTLLEYSATDACATYHLYQRIMEDLEDESDRPSTSENTIQ